MEKKRSFVSARSETGTAAQIRSQVSAAFSAGGLQNGNPTPGAASAVGTAGSSRPGSSLSGSAFAGLIGIPSEAGRSLSHSVSMISTVPMELSEPIDYEDFVKKSQGMLEGVSQRDLVLFPEDDVAVMTLPRKFRTIEIPVPGPVKRCDDPLVGDCVHSFTQDWTVVNRKYGSFHGQDEQFLSRRFTTCRRTPSYTNLLPKHQYEVDMPKNEIISDVDKKLYRASMTSTIDYNLEAAESNHLMLNLLDVGEDLAVDQDNSEKRATGRHHSLFGLYPLLDRGEAKETRNPVPPPSEHKGLRLHVKVSELRFDLNIEPVFAVMALYDAKEKKKISESFHLDCNPSDIQQKWKDNREERSLASLSRSAIFNITYPSSDVYLIIKIEKILQQGDISDASEPYLKSKDLDKKSLDKYKSNANFFCQQLRKYHMPFAWTAIGVLDILAGNQGNGLGGGAAAMVGGGASSEGRKSSVYEKEGTLEKGGGTTETNKRRDTLGATMSSQTSRSGLEDSYSAEREANARKRDNVVTLTQNFCPVTLTVNGFFRQEGDKLSDEDLYRSLAEMKKSLAAFSRKIKSIPGNLKVDISAPDDNMSCCLTSSLWEIDPFPDKRTKRPTREIEEFPPREVYSPYTTYKNMLYVYPLSLDFRSGKGRNIGVRVQFLSGEEKEDVCPAIYGKSCSPSFLREAWCPVVYHNRQPEFYEEVKIELPAKLTDKHHLLFQFYQISCKPRQGEAHTSIQEPTYIGCTWIPMLEDGKIQMGEFNLPVAAERPPAGYSQLSTHVCLPNLKWIDSHKPVFRVNVSMVSSIHPKDNHLLDFMLAYYKRSSHPSDEKDLSNSIGHLRDANPESLVQFLHTTLSNLCGLLIRPSTVEESFDIPSKAFEALANIIQQVSNLDLYTDKHDRNLILASYVQYVFDAPQSQASAVSATFEGRISTLTKSRAGSGGTADEEFLSAQAAAAAAFKKGGSVRGTKGVSFNIDIEEIPETGTTVRRPSHSSAKKLFHEELVLQWIVVHPSSRPLVLKNAWFFFEILVKAMAQHLNNSNKLNSQRRDRFSTKFMEDLDTLVGSIAMEICNKHVQNVDYAKCLNTSLAFFIHDAFSLMDRGFVFVLIKTYLKKFTLSVKDLNLPEFRLDFLRIVCSHEHYVVLNLPLGTVLYSAATGSQHSSPSGSISSTYESLDMPNVEAMGELSHEFRHFHYLSGLVLSELAQVLADGKSPKLREQAIQVLRDLLASHDSDLRYNNAEARAKIASIYLPLLSIVMDNYQILYKGADGWEDWSTTFERNTAVKRRSVVIRGDATDGSLDIEQDYPVEKVENVLGPVSTRNLLVCFLWVIRSVDKELISNWWFTLSITRLDSLLNVLDLCVSCFEYRGKRHLTNQPSNIGAASKGGDVKSQLANTILHGEGSARERLRLRKAQAQFQAQADVLRWGKTYWQAASEHTDRPKIDVEVDAKIEGSLAAEASLIVLDTLELLVQTLSLEGQAMLGRTMEALLHLMGSNQSTEVLRNIFATQRAIVSKFPELVFEDETELCAELCIRLLRHCSSNVPEVRALACSSIYLLMRQNYNELGSTFARVKVQLTVALSSIVAGTSTFNEHHLRRSLKTFITYVQNDEEMNYDENFSEQVRELSLNLHRILLDTVKMQEFQDDPEMLMDLMYRISKGYQDSPDLRLTWLQHMADKHITRQNYTEAAMCLVHAAALVAEYLYLLEGRPHLPIGCVAFQKLSPNVLEESAVSDNLISPEEEGICTSKSFSEQGLVDLLENAASYFFEDQVYEAVNEVYKLIIPIYESQLNHAQLGKVYVKLSDCYRDLVTKGQHRFLCSFFRVGFYGLIFGDLDGEVFIYREAALTRLGEFSLRLQKLYQDKLGDGMIELIKDSGAFNPASLNPSKGYLQITYVEPYFDEWENKERVTVYDRFFNIRRFAFNTPFTPSGKAHGDVTEQYMRKTILTSMECFPYVKKRSKVIKLDTVELPPLEVAILGMQEKIESLKDILSQNPPDAKLLQMQLQGGIATSVNQGPFHIAKSFLDIPSQQYTYHHRRLKVCFKEFTKRCWEALEVNKKLITEEQKDYQKELMSNFKVFCDKLEPMVSTKKRHKRSRDRVLINIAGTGTARSSRHYSSSSTSTETS